MGVKLFYTNNQSQTRQHNKNKCITFQKVVIVSVKYLNFFWKKKKENGNDLFSTKGNGKNALSV